MRLLRVLAACIAVLFLAAPGYAMNSLTIGVVTDFPNIIVCQQQLDAEFIAKAIAAKGMDAADEMHEVISKGMCAVGNGQAEPLTVVWSGPVVDTDLINKVVLVTLDPAHPGPDNEMYLVTTDEVIGSGIQEKHDFGDPTAYHGDGGSMFHLAKAEDRLGSPPVKSRLVTITKHRRPIGGAGHQLDLGGFDQVLSILLRIALHAALGL